MPSLQSASPAHDVAENASPTDETSQPYVRRWNKLVSTTNWEKGRIVLEWRHALIESGAAAPEYSDEAWARHVGAVSGQHVGRLRRVHERFGTVREQYKGLFWSHFQAALEWPDPELWLEGAVQNGWSVSAMRRQRWESYGAPESEKPRDSDIIAAEFDEDVVPVNEHGAAPGGAKGSSDRFTGKSSGSGGPDLNQGPDFGAESVPFDAGDHAAEGPPHSLYVSTSGVESIRPFENLPDLPADIAEAMEMFKLSILRHKLDHWTQVAAEHVLQALDGLRHLVLAPAEGGAA